MQDRTIELDKSEYDFFNSLVKAFKENSIESDDIAEAIYKDKTIIYDKEFETLVLDNAPGANFQLKKTTERDSQNLS